MQSSAAVLKQDVTSSEPEQNTTYCAEKVADFVSQQIPLAKRAGSHAVFAHALYTHMIQQSEGHPQ